MGACNAIPISSPARPFIAILGGAKISDKIGVVQNLLPRADRVLIGGGMANTFLKARGLEMGDSLVEADAIETAKSLLFEHAEQLVLPSDAVVADRFDKDAKSEVVEVFQVQPGWRILDIGPKTVELFKSYFKDAQTIVWNGPLGVFEFPRFAAGTMAIARAVASTQATTIIGGGESVAAVEPAAMPATCVPWRQPSSRQAWRSASRTSVPAAAPRSNSSRARRCPASPRCWTNNPRRVQFHTQA